MKTATYAQEGDNRTINTGRASEVNYHEEGVAAEAGCFNIDLNRASHGR